MPAESEDFATRCQTNHLKLAPWQLDPGIRLFAPEPFEQTDRMLSLDRKVWQELGSPDALIVTITVDVGHVHVLAEPGGSCTPSCPHPDHRTEETPDAG